MNKQQLIQEIKDMRNKLASMEAELNNSNPTINHFPKEGDKFYYYTYTGLVSDNIACSNDIKVNVFQTYDNAQDASNKAIAVEKVNRRILEIQGEWVPNWNDVTEPKLYIVFDNDKNKFSLTSWYTCKQYCPIYVIKSRSLAEQIITEMNIELKIIFNIQD